MPRACAPQQREATAMRSLRATGKSSHHFLQLEKARVQQRRPIAAKNKLINLFLKQRGVCQNEDTKINKQTREWSNEPP